MAKATLLAAAPREDLLLTRNTHRVKRTTLNSADRQLDAVLLENKVGWCSDTLDSAKAERTVFAITPRVHFIVTGQREDMANTTRDLYDLGTESRESDHGRPSDD